MTTRRRARPSVLCCAISRMVLIDSCLAESMNAHVFTTRTSASAAFARDLVPGTFGKPQHDLGVDEVLGAAEGYQTNLHECLMPNA